MEPTTIVWLACVPIFITIVWTKIARGTTASAPTTKRSLPPPPVAAGARLLGILPALLAKGPLQAIRDAYETTGSVFTVRLLHLQVTFLVGPEVSSHFYHGLDSEISQDEVSQFTIPTFGPGVAFDVDIATRREQFRFFGDAMKPAKLRTYARLMAREVEEYFKKWVRSGTVDLKQELEHLVTLMASRCLFGEEVRAKIFGEVATHLRELNDGMRLVTILFPHLPTPAHRRRDRARARLGEIFSDIVRSRKAERRGGHDDMLQCLIDSRYKDGRATTETEVAGMLVAALFAGQHTSSSTATWTGARLLSPDNAAYLRAAVEEQERIKERHGPDPDRFDPSRLGGPDRGTSLAYTAFGGGRHACVGEAFAYMQIKAIWSLLLRNFEMEMVSSFPETDWNVVMPGPKGKVVVSYKRRRMAAAA